MSPQGRHEKDSKIIICSEVERTLKMDNLDSIKIKRSLPKCRPENKKINDLQ